MNPALGVSAIALGAVMAISTILLWGRLSPPVALGAIAVASMLVGTGGLLVQDGVSASEWVLTLVVFAAFGPIEARLVFGRSGERA